MLISYHLLVSARRSRSITLVTQPSGWSGGSGQARTEAWTRHEAQVASPALDAAELLSRQDGPSWLETIGGAVASGRIGDRQVRSSAPTVTSIVTALVSVYDRSRASNPGIKRPRASVIVLQIPFNQ